MLGETVGGLGEAMQRVKTHARDVLTRGTFRRERRNALRTDCPLVQCDTHEALTNSTGGGRFDT